MTVTQTTATGDGVTTVFPITFKYFEDRASEVKVALYDATTELWVDQTTPAEWSLKSITEVEFVTAPPASDTANILIYRKTTFDPLEAEFYPGSAIRAQDLNANFQQLQYAIQDSDTGIDDLNDKIIEIIENPYELPVATTTELGGVIIGENLSITAEGVLSAESGGGGDPGVSKIIAGTNVTISPTSGVGNVTISSTGGTSTGGVTYKGTRDLTLEAPSNPDNGDFYINTATSGNANVSWTGLNEIALDGGERVIYNDSTLRWDMLPSEASGVENIVAGNDITVNSTDPSNPIVSVTPNSFVRPNEITGFIDDAPSDGKCYVRKDSAWYDGALKFMPLNISTLPTLP